MTDKNNRGKLDSHSRLYGRLVDLAPCNDGYVIYFPNGSKVISRHVVCNELFTNVVPFFPSSASYTFNNGDQMMNLNTTDNVTIHSDVPHSIPNTHVDPWSIIRQAAIHEPDSFDTLEHSAMLSTISTDILFANADDSTCSTEVLCMYTLHL